MALLARLMHTRSTPVQPAARRLPRPEVHPAQPADERPPGCGWFDSSHDLHTGLHVTEHREVESVVNQIPLSWWLGWELDAARPPVR